MAGGDGACGGCWRGGHQEGGALWLRPFPPPLPSLEAELRRPGAFHEPADSPEALTHQETQLSHPQGPQWSSYLMLSILSGQSSNASNLMRSSP